MRGAAFLQGVQRLVSLVASVDRVSDVRLKKSVASTLLGVSGDMFVIDARTNATVAVSRVTVISSRSSTPFPPNSLLRRR